jgi:predicted hydrocarbon binding protein
MQIKKIELFDLSRPRVDAAATTLAYSSAATAAYIAPAAKKTLVDIGKYYGIMFANEKEPNEFDKLFAGIGFKIRC